MPSRQKPSLYLCRPLLQLQSGDAPPELIKDILQMSVEESLHLPAMFMLVVHNTYLSGYSQDKPWRHEKYFKIGDKLKLGFAASTTEASVFSEETKDYLIEGEITAIEVNFTNKSEAHIVVRGYDVSHRLHRGRYNRSFLNKTDSDIVRKIASEVGIQLGKVDASGEPHDYVFQENQTNMEFLRERAARIGFELFIQDNKLNFRKPVSNASLSLQWLRDIYSFSTRVTSAEQVSAVEVRSWDYTQKKLISSTASSENLVTATGNGKGSSTSTKFNLNSKPPKMTVVDQPVFKPKEAQTMAQALCNELGGEFVYADAKGEGNPLIRAGRVINLEGMGDRYSGKYYVTETRHFYSQLVYTTEFSVRGLRGGSLFTTLSPQVHLQPGQTFLVGIVTNNQDPKGWGRVKVKFPTLTEEHESNWARVVGLGAGQSRGFYCLPEVNDEVLVGFEHGDIHRPYIIGGVWNGKDATPETVNNTIQGGKVRLRTIKTRTGHTIEFVEEDKGGSFAGVRIETAGGHKLHLNDSKGYVEIKTSGGHQLQLDDRLKNVEIKTRGGHQLQLNDTLKKVEIQSSGGHQLQLNDTLKKVEIQTRAGHKINMADTPLIPPLGPTISVSSIGSLVLSANGNLILNPKGMIIANKPIPPIIPPPMIAALAALDALNRVS